MMFGFAVLAAFAAVAVAFPQENRRELCGDSSCGANAYCKRANGLEECVCTPGTYGSGYGTGCSFEQPPCTNDTDCKDDEHCNESNLCEYLCSKCPMDGGCLARNHRYECTGGGMFWNPHSLNSTTTVGDFTTGTVPSENAAPSGGAATSRR